MDANIKNPQDALEWLERHIHEEAGADGEMTNEHAIQLGFIQNMLAKFPRRNCDRFATETDAQIAFLKEVWLIGVGNLDRDPFDGWTNEMKSAYSKWLIAPATEQEGGAK